MFGKALYYPTIDIRDEEWLKNAYLFWDGISTIAPASLQGNAYHNNTTQYLEDEGFLKLIKVSPDTPAVRDMVKVVKRYAQTEEGMAYLNERLPEDVYSNPYDDERSEFYLHHEKLPFEVQQLIADKIGDDGWARVSENFANFYMTLLANKIARQKSMALLTSEKNHDSLSACLSIDTYRRPFTAAHSNAESLGRCMLTRMIIEGIRLDPLTSFERLQDFKRGHEEELRNFRNGLEEMAKMEVPPDITIEGLEQKVKDIYQNKFLLDYKNLQDALQGFGIHFLIGGTATLAFSDISTCFNDAIAGLPHPTQLMIGAGALFAYKGYQTVKENQEAKRRHRMAYVLSIERELGRVSI